jgi:cbb3-type cytochrome oxidase maturation protein
MTVIIILLSVSILISGGFLLAFLWSVGNGQFDDPYAPAQRILFDKTKKQQASIKKTKTV